MGSSFNTRRTGKKHYEKDIELVSYIINIISTLTVQSKCLKRKFKSKPVPSFCIQF